MLSDDDELPVSHSMAAVSLHRIYGFLRNYASNIQYASIPETGCLAISCHTFDNSIPQAGRLAPAINRSAKKRPYNPPIFHLTP
jgi:hypothetical protein